MQLRMLEEYQAQRLQDPMDAWEEPSGADMGAAHEGSSSLLGDARSASGSGREGDLGVQQLPGRGGSSSSSMSFLFPFGVGASSSSALSGLFPTMQSRPGRGTRR